MTTITSFLFVFIANLLFCLLPAVEAKENNVTIDDHDSSISYSGQWNQSTPSGLDYGGSHMLSNQGDSTATIKFTGVAVYMLSPKWPYTVNTAVQLDGGQKQTVDLVDHGRPSTNGGPETVGWSVVWSATNLKNDSHTLVLSMASQNNYVVSDGFIYTQSLPDDSSSSSKPSATPSASAISGASTADTSSARQRVTIALGATFGGLFIVFAVSVLLFIRRRKRQQAALYARYGASGASWAEKPSLSNTNSRSGSSIGTHDIGKPVNVDLTSTASSTHSIDGDMFVLVDPGSVAAPFHHGSVGSMSESPASLSKFPAPPQTTYHPSSLGYGTTYAAQNHDRSPPVPIRELTPTPAPYFHAASASPEPIYRDPSPALSNTATLRQVHEHEYDHEASPPERPRRHTHVRQSSLNLLAPDARMSVYDPTAPNPYVGGGGKGDRRSEERAMAPPLPPHMGFQQQHEYQQRYA